MSIAVEDWDDLSVARRRRDERAAGEADATAAETDEDAPEPDAYGLIIADIAEDDDSLERHTENLRPVLSIAGGNIAIWVLAHLTGVVELIGVSFFASVGMLLAAYVLREWHRDRASLVCLVGALPLPLTIIGLLT
jgi:hypothetical protein